MFLNLYNKCCRIIWKYQLINKVVKMSKNKIKYNIINLIKKLG